VEFQVQSSPCPHARNANSLGGADIEWVVRGLACDATAGELHGDAGSVRELLRESGDRNAGSLGAAANDRNDRRQGVTPEVVGLPPGDLVEKVGLESAVGSGGNEDGVLDLAVLTPTKLALRQELLTQAFVGDRSVRCNASEVEGVAGEAKEHFSGECVVAGVKLDA
jgi:hypothetical protein